VPLLFLWLSLLLWRIHLPPPGESCSRVAGARVNGCSRGWCAVTDRKAHPKWVFLSVICKILYLISIKIMKEIVIKSYKFDDEHKAHRYRIHLHARRVQEGRRR